MSQIEKITVSGYKSINSLKKFELGSLNVLIGANGAGKSNFIGLFKLLNEIYEQRLQLYTQKQGGPDALLHFGRKKTNSLIAQFAFGQNEYRFSLLPTDDNRLVFEAEDVAFHGEGYEQPYVTSLKSGHNEAELKNTNTSIASYVKNSVRKWRVYHFHDTSDTAKVKMTHAINDNLELKPNAENLAAYLRMLHDEHNAYYKRIVDTVRLALPFFGDFVYREGDIENIQLEWFQKNNSDTPLKAHVLSDGSLRLICLMVLLLQPEELLPDTILIDEPELGLHPYAITVLSDVIKQVSESKQLIIATQSVELVNLLEPQDVVVVNQKDDASTFERLDAKSLSIWLEDYTLGELWKQNVFGGRP